MNLIKLHCFDNSAPKKMLDDFYLNSDCIISFCKDPNSSYTEITTYGDEIYYVRETPSELIEIINKGKVSKLKPRKESQNKDKNNRDEVADSINGIQTGKIQNCSGPIMTGDAKIASYKPTSKRVKRGRFKRTSKVIMPGYRGQPDTRW